MGEDTKSEITRLEELWAEDFGCDYSLRNADAGAGRERFWSTIIDLTAAQSILEVGCNVGPNLFHLAQLITPRNVYGVDINEQALATARARLPQVNTVWGQARRLPFRDSMFDLVFTSGVLIHQPEIAVPLVIAEMARCSRRFVLAVEYADTQTVEVPYRAERGALFRRDYGRYFTEVVPDLQPTSSGTLDHGDGWDDTTWWLFQKKC